MRFSRGMGAINPSKMPKAKSIVKRDGDEPVKVYKRGGKVKKFSLGGDLLNAAPWSDSQGDPFTKQGIFNRTNAALNPASVLAPDSFNQIGWTNPVGNYIVHDPNTAYSNKEQEMEAGAYATQNPVYTLNSQGQVVRANKKGGAIKSRAKRKK